MTEGDCLRYRDYAVVMLEMMHATRSFTMVCSEHAIRKMLWKEHVQLMVMSTLTMDMMSVNHDLMPLLSRNIRFGRSWSGSVCIYGIRAVLNDDMDTGDILMVDSHNDRISVHLTCI